MNKDCSKVSIERGSDGRFTMLLTGSKDDMQPSAPRQKPN